jgi:hypothetical protein
MPDDGLEAVMDNSIRNLMGLDDGKREYSQVDGAVDRYQFEYIQTLHTVLFRPKGYAETLGPTWQMIHDPRFSIIEQVAVVRRKGKAQDSAIERGVVKQNAAGEFDPSNDDISFYAEVLSEGRYIVKYLRSKRYDAAISELFWTRTFTIPRKTYEPGLLKFAQLNLADRARVEAYIADPANALVFERLYPARVQGYSEQEKWDLIKEVASNYFRKDGTVNASGHLLFALLGADLAGLVDDYAEIANLQEWVVLDSEFELANPDDGDSDTPIVWAEVEMLEKALIFRTNIRVTAARILQQIGITSHLKSVDLQLTEQEQDALFTIIFNSDWPNDKAELMVSTLQFITSASATPFEERVQRQTSEASREARAYVEGLKSGSIRPVNRESDGVVEPETEAGKLLSTLGRNPIKEAMLLRLTNAEAGILSAQKESNPDDTSELDQDSTEVSRANAEGTIARLTPVVELLRPYFGDTNTFVDLTKEEVEDLLAKADELDPATPFPINTFSESDGAAWYEAQGYSKAQAAELTAQSS